MNKNTLVFILSGIVALSGGLMLQNISSNDKTETLAASLQFSLPDSHGKIRTISEWQGKIRIINFWATWCPPCLKEIPEFIKLQNRFQDKGVQFIGIAVEDKEAVLPYLKTIPINYPILIGEDDGIVLSQQLGNIVNAVPFTVIVNRRGQLIYQHPGELTTEKIMEIINPLL